MTEKIDRVVVSRHPEDEMTDGVWTFTDTELKAELDRARMEGEERARRGVSEVHHELALKPAAKEALERLARKAVKDSRT